MVQVLGLISKKLSFVGVLCLYVIYIIKALR